MVNISNKENCVSCFACYNICPKDAIKMVEDKEGFKYPEIDKTKCINCGLCSKVCPMINKAENNKEKPKVIAGWSKNKFIQKDSTSGGIFSELANIILNENGYISGAVYNKEWKVEHIITNEKKKLKEIRSSKYLQSDINNTYKEIKEKLDKGFKVLFCGSPCQVAALNNFLGKNYDDLYTCDFICRGMNSPKIFKMYIEDLEHKYKSKVKSVKFKHKKYGWHNFHTMIEFEDGKKYFGNRYIDPYMLGYLKYNAFMRPSCYECRFKDMPRKGDITLADFWGIENIDKSLDNDMGTSMVLINSKKGEVLFNKIKDNIEYKEINLDMAFKDNICAYQSPEKTEVREKVFENIDKMSFKELNSRFFIKPKAQTRMKIYIKRSKVYRKLKEKTNGHKFKRYFSK